MSAISHCHARVCRFGKPALCWSCYWLYLRGFMDWRGHATDA